jgi:DNA-binding MurR/RpiR family transcriptional regulator
MNVKDRLQQKYSSLTPVYQKICGYLIDNYNNIEQLSMQQISRESGFGLSSIFRLCQKLGYRGFKELRDEVLKEHNRPDSGQKESLEEAVLNFEISMVEEIRGILISDNYKKAVESCVQADRLVWIGIGDSANMLPLIDFRCNVINLPSSYVADPVMYQMAIDDLDKTSVILMISQSGNTSLLRDAMEYAVRSPALFIGLTSNEDSILAKSSDISITIPSMNIKTIKHYFSLRGPLMFFLDLFLISIGKKKSSISQEELNCIFED